MKLFRNIFKHKKDIKDVTLVLLGFVFLLVGTPLAFVGGEWTKVYIIISIPFYVVGVLYVFNFINKDE